MSPVDPPVSSDPTDAETEAAEAAAADAPDQSDRQTSPESILATQLVQGLSELRRPADGLLLSGVSAGLDIGFGPLLMAVTLTLAGDAWGVPLTDLAIANAYAIGFVFVILGRSELFTEHTTLAVLPVLDGQASVRALSRLWGLVYLGNVVGGVLFALFGVWVAVDLGTAEPAAFAEIASSLTDHGNVTIVAAAVLAGWLMGLMSWLVAAAQETISRLVIVWVIAATIGFAHLPHCIAGTVEVVGGVVVGETSILEFGRFLLLATVGNAVGGAVFVSLLKYGHVVRGGSVAND